MRNSILLIILSFSFFGCVTQTLPTQALPTNPSVPTPYIIYTASARPVASSTQEETEVVSTVTPSPFPKEIFYFGATPLASQVGGINSVYYRQYLLDENCPQIYEILRFYKDGLVLTAPFCWQVNTDFLEIVWPEISTWLSRDNDDQYMGRGTYYIAENKMWFTSVVEDGDVVTDYIGTFSKDRIVLNSFSHYNGHQSTEEFIFSTISEDP